MERLTLRVLPEGWWFFSRWQTRGLGRLGVSLVRFHRTSVSNVLHVWVIAIGLGWPPVNILSGLVSTDWN